MLQAISLLDCTLRDGGYVNDWDFGPSVMAKIIRKTVQAGIDFIECGYLSMKNSGKDGLARYSSIDDLRRAYASAKGDGQQYAVMVNYGEYPADLLPSAIGDEPVIRVAFHKKDKDAALDYMGTLCSKGYRVFAQPMGAQNYSDGEYIELIQQINGIPVLAFYVVDSFGVMEIRDFSRLLLLCDNNLDRRIPLGYHSHNNLQQAYGNAKYMVELGLNRPIIIDATAFGIGRGAGNLNIELFARYLNENWGKHYDIEPILEVYDECLKPLLAKNPWGYSLPFYLSAIYNCHPNYAVFLSERNTLSVKSMHEILSRISDDEKLSFSEERANRYYTQYQQVYVDDKDILDAIASEVSGRNVLVLAPGRSIKERQSDVERFIADNDPVVFGVGNTFDAYNYDYLFVANEKRFSGIDQSKADRIIATSNIHHDNPGVLTVNYASLLCQDSLISDNAALMLINLLISVGVRRIVLAGFDGYSANPDENYFSEELSLGSKLQSKLQKNAVITSQIEKLSQRVELVFLTPSKYVS